MTKQLLVLLATLILGHQVFSSDDLAGDSPEQMTVTGLARSFPFSGNLEAQYKRDFLIWDQRSESKIKFGYVQPRVMAAAAGTLDTTIAIYPISLLEMTVGVSYTSRFYKLKKFECDIQICDGTVRRNKFGIRALLGHEFEFGAVILIPSYQTVVSNHTDDSKPLVDEQEVNLTRNGGDEAQINSVMAGLKREEEIIGVVHRYSYLKYAGTSSEAQYLIYRFKMNEIGYMVGAGQYKSDFNERGFSAIFSLQWQTGQSIGLF